MLHYKHEVKINLCLKSSDVWKLPLRKVIYLLGCNFLMGLCTQTNKETTINDMLQ